MNPSSCFFGQILNPRRRQSLHREYKGRRKYLWSRQKERGPRIVQANGEEAIAVPVFVTQQDAGFCFSSDGLPWRRARPVEQHRARFGRRWGWDRGLMDQIPQTCGSRTCPTATPHSYTVHTITTNRIITLLPTKPTNCKLQTSPIRYTRVLYWEGCSASPWSLEQANIFYFVIQLWNNNNRGKVVLDFPDFTLHHQ